MYIKRNLPLLQTLSKVLDAPLVFVDLETTGMVHERHFALIEIGIVKITDEKIEQKSSLINPRMKIPSYITDLTGISDDMVQGSPVFDEKFANYFNKLAEGSVLCGFNSKSFDSKGLEKLIKNYGFNNSFLNQIDVKHMYGRHHKIINGKYKQSGKLMDIKVEFGIETDASGGSAHRALYDITVTALIAEYLLGFHNFGILYKDVSKFSNENFKKNFINYLFTKKISPL